MTARLGARRQPTRSVPSRADESPLAPPELFSREPSIDAPTQVFERRLTKLELAGHPDPLPAEFVNSEQRLLAALRVDEATIPVTPRPSKMSLFSRSSTLACLLVASQAASCGGLTAALGAIGGGGGGGGGTGNTPTTIGDLTIGSDALDSKVSPLSFSFRLTDAQSDSADISVLYVPQSGAPVAATLVGDTNLNGLATSPQGVVHVRQWDFASQLSSGAAYASGYRLIVRTSANTASTESAPFDVGNDAPIVSNVQVPSAQSGAIAPINLTCSDSSNDHVSITVEYEDVGGSAGWKTATPVGPGLSNVAATSAGVALIFFWNVGADEPGRNFDAHLRFVADDGTTSAPPVVSPTFSIHENTAPVVVVNGSAFLATPDERRGIPLPFEALDNESDPVRVIFQWRRPFESFPALPPDNASIDAILADEDARLAYHIATEKPLMARGRVVPDTSTTLHAAELSACASGVRLAGLVGREIDVLRASDVPAPVAASWSTDPLASPAAALARHDGRTALVLDSAGAGSWRLREIDLATGSVLSWIAGASNGSPDAMTYLGGDESVLIACDLAGVWTLDEVELATGVTTSWITTSGASALGAVRGMAWTGGRTCLITVASDLVEVDANTPASPIETALITGLATPWGIALDPTRKDKLYLAERDWINPATSATEGRLDAVEISALTITQVVTSGVSLRRPDAIAFEPMNARLLVATDQNTADGQRELCAADVGGKNGIPAWTVTSALPDGVSWIATSSERTRLVTLRATNDVAVGGGVEQTRSISAYDALDCRITVASAFQPAPSALERWRIVDTTTSLALSGGSTSDTFVWDSEDLSTGGDVVLRATPYDSQQGQSTDTGVPRHVRSPIDVHGTLIGSSTTTNGVRTIALGDLNGDGTPDIVTANSAANKLSIFYSTGSGQFPSTPNATLNVGGASFPLAVAILDVDNDGRLDIVSADRDANNIAVFRQNGGGTFSLQTTISTGTSPSCIAVGDVNNDGLPDVVVGDAGSDNVKVFLQTGGGLSSFASSTLNCGNGSAPASVALGDVNGDGRLDIVVAAKGTNGVLVFLHNAGFGYPNSPSLTLGGTGVTDAPSAVALGDLDGDGALDIACANVGDNDLAVFMHAASGLYTATPTFLLASPDGPFQPAGLAITDLNSDGSLDVVATSIDGALVAYFYEHETHAFAPEDLRIDGEGTSALPIGLVAGDLDGDGHTDLVVADSGLSQVAVLLQRGAGTFNTVPDATFGSAVDTSGPAALAVGDLDGDGNLDIVCANQGTDDLAIYRQFSPTIVGIQPKQRLGGSGSTTQVSAVEIADVDGDGRPDIVTANSGAGTLTIFFQKPDGTFATLPDVTLGGLGGPIALVVTDLDGDGDLDLACANSTGNDVRVFLQTAPRVFATPGVTLGGASGPSALIAADFNADGRCDLACANQTNNTIAIYLQSSLGAFPASPSFTLGSGSLTPNPRALAAADIDNDGLIDIACANGTGNRVVIFRQTSAGTFNATPAATITHSSMQQPSSLVLADFDGDGAVDLFVGATASQNLCLFRQLRPWTFAVAPDLVGGPSTTGAPVGLRAVDFDGDGDCDLVLARPAFNSFALFYNSH
jgi:hypothetical protein